MSVVSGDGLKSTYTKTKTLPKATIYFLCWTVFVTSVSLSMIFIVSFSCSLHTFLTISIDCDYFWYRLLDLSRSFQTALGFPRWSL